MKIFRLLEELCKELKTFNQNVEYFSLLETEVVRRKNNPLKAMTDLEISDFKDWLKNLLEEKKVSLGGHSYHTTSAERFIFGRYNRSTKEVRELISKALGYKTFNELLAVYRKEKGGNEKVPVQYIGTINVDADLHEAKYPQDAGRGEGGNAG